MSLSSTQSSFTISWPQQGASAFAGAGVCVQSVLVHIPVKEQQNGQHGLVDVAVADAFIEKIAGVPDHRLQGVLSHDVVQLICV